MKEYRHPELKEVPLSAALQALADPCRVAIVRAILTEASQELPCNAVPLSQSKATVSHHFEVLREAGVIRTRVEGTRCLSSVREAEFEARFPGLLQLILAEGPAQATG